MKLNPVAFLLSKNQSAGIATTVAGEAKQPTNQLLNTMKTMLTLAAVCAAAIFLTTGCCSMCDKKDGACATSCAKAAECQKCCKDAAGCAKCCKTPEDCAKCCGSK